MCKTCLTFIRGNLSAWKLVQIRCVLVTVNRDTKIKKVTVDFEIDDFFWDIIATDSFSQDKLYYR